MGEQINNIKLISKLALILKKIMIYFYYEDDEFQKEIDFFEQLDISKKGFISQNELESF